MYVEYDFGMKQKNVRHQQDFTLFLTIFVLVDANASFCFQPCLNRVSDSIDTARF